MESSDSKVAGMDWKRVVRYSLALLLAGAVVGLVSGLFAVESVRDAARIEAIGTVAVFAIYLAVFARMAAGAAARPIAGAVAAAFFAIVLSLTLSWALSAAWPQVFPVAIDALAAAVEASLLALAATFGVGLGAYLRDRSAALAKASSRDSR